MAWIKLSIQGSNRTRQIIVFNKYPRRECLGARADCIGGPDQQGDRAKLGSVVIEANDRPLSPDRFTCFGNACTNDRQQTSGNQRTYQIRLHAENNSIFSLDNVENIDWNISDTDSFVASSPQGLKGETISLTNTEVRGNATLSAFVTPKQGYGNPINVPITINNSPDQFQVRDIFISTNGQFLNQDAFGCAGDACAEDDRNTAQAGNQHELKAFVADSSGRFLSLDSEKVHWSVSGENEVINLSSTSGSTVYATNTAKKGSVVVTVSVEGVSAIGSLAIENKHPYKKCMEILRTGDEGEDITDRMCTGFPDKQGNPQILETPVIDAKGRPIPIDRFTCFGAACPDSIDKSSAANANRHFYQLRLHAQNNSLLALAKIKRIQWNLSPTQAFTDLYVPDLNKGEFVTLKNTNTPGTAILTASIIPVGGAVQTAEIVLVNDVKMLEAEVTPPTAQSPSAQCKNGSPDGVKAVGEQCDDGDGNDANACKNSCQGNSGFCGNGVKDIGEYCDDGDLDNSNQCPNDCSDCARSWQADTGTTTPANPANTYQFNLSYCAQGKGKKLSELLISPTKVGARAVPEAQEPALEEYFYRMADSSNHDVVILKVFDNSNLLAPLVWYKKNSINPGEQPAPILIDGFPGLRDSSGVYAAIPTLNADGSFKGSYILHFTTNKGAVSGTKDILNAIVQKAKFAISITDSMRAASLRRDMQRIADIGFIEYVLDSYKERVGCGPGFPCYPALEAGSYIKRQTVSGWPSWNLELGKELSASMPMDPLQRSDLSKPFGDCLGGIDFNPKTCWNEKNKQFYNGSVGVEQALFSASSSFYAYTYTYGTQEKKYQICAKLEYFASSQSVMRYCKKPGEQAVSLSGTQEIERISGFILVEFWNDLVNEINGTLEALKNAIKNLISPSFTTYFRKFELQEDSDDNYGTRLRGYFTPSEDGSYTFYIASDDSSELYLSPDEKPYRKELIAKVQGRTGFRQWTKNESQKSAPKNLTAGNKYYIEALHKENTDSAHVSVAWQNGVGEIIVLGSDNISSFVPVAAQCAPPKVDNGSNACINCPEWSMFDGFTGCVDCGGAGQPKCEITLSNTAVCKGTLSEVNGACACTQWQNRSGEECTACGGAGGTKCSLVPDTAVENKNTAVCKGTLSEVNGACACAQWQNRDGINCSSCGGAGENLCFTGDCKGTLSIKKVNGVDKCVCADWQNRSGNQCTPCGGPGIQKCAITPSNKVFCKGTLTPSTKASDRDKCVCADWQNRSGNQCTSCGGAGQPKCATGSACKDNRWVVTVNTIDRCACDPWNNISDNGCTSCGGAGQPKCSTPVSGKICKGTLKNVNGICGCFQWQNTSQDNQCSDCGGFNEPKCTGTAVPNCKDSSLSVDVGGKCSCTQQWEMRSGNSNQCIACGGDTESACDGVRCKQGMVKDGGTCRRDTDGDLTADRYDECPDETGPSGSNTNSGCPFPELKSMIMYSNIDFHFVCNEQGYNCNAVPANFRFDWYIDNADSVDVYYYAPGNPVGEVLAQNLPPRPGAGISAGIDIKVSPEFSVAADNPFITLAVKRSGSGHYKYFNSLPIDLHAPKILAVLSASQTTNGRLALKTTGYTSERVTVNGEEAQKFSSVTFPPGFDVTSSQSAVPAWDIVRVFGENENQSSVAVFSDIRDVYGGDQQTAFEFINLADDTCDPTPGALNRRFNCSGAERSCVDYYNVQCYSTVGPECTVNYRTVTCFNHNPPRPEGY